MAPHSEKSICQSNDDETVAFDIPTKIASPMFAEIGATSGATQKPSIAPFTAKKVAVAAIFVALLCGVFCLGIAVQLRGLQQRFESDLAWREEEAAGAMKVRRRRSADDEYDEEEEVAKRVILVVADAARTEPTKPGK